LPFLASCGRLCRLRHWHWTGPASWSAGRTTRLAFRTPACATPSGPEPQITPRIDVAMPSIYDLHQDDVLPTITEALADEPHGLAVAERA
jgi:hypothetical protein